MDSLIESSQLIHVIASFSTDRPIYANVSGRTSDPKRIHASPEGAVISQTLFNVDGLVSKCNQHIFLLFHCANIRSVIEYCNALMTNISVNEYRKLKHIQNRARAIAERTSMPLIKRRQSALCGIMQHIKGDMTPSPNSEICMRKMPCRGCSTKFKLPKHRLTRTQQGLLLPRSFCCTLASFYYIIFSHANSILVLYYDIGVRLLINTYIQKLDQDHAISKEYADVRWTGP